MRLRSMLAVAAVLAALLAMPRSSAAQSGCEDCAIFNVDANFSNGGAITGQLFFEPPTGTFIGDALTASGFAPGANGAFTNIPSQGPDGGVDYVLDINGPSSLELSLPVVNPAGYSGQISTSYDGFLTTSGTLKPALAATPEPSGILLLATGLLGIGVLIRRQLPASCCGVLRK